MKKDASRPVWVKAANVPVVGVRDVPYRHVVVPGWDVDVGHTGEEPSKSKKWTNDKAPTKPTSLQNGIIYMKKGPRATTGHP